MQHLEAMIQKKESIEKELLARPGVSGVDVGYKYVKGVRTEEIAIRVHVKHKKKDVSKADKIPSDYDGFITDVIERTYELQNLSKKAEDVTLLADTNHYNPLLGGISIGPDRSIGGFIFAGTLGAIVKDNATGNPLMLSNFHVMCVDNTWHVGDKMDQPSLIDTGTHADVVGTLLRDTLSSHVDGAVATISGRTFKCEIADIGAVKGTATAVLGSAVRKRGRTTLLTFGFVDSVSSSVNIDYGDGIGVKTLTNQIGVRSDTAHNPKFSDHGDSGSVIVDANNKVIALLFAGSSDGHTIGNPISSVLSELNISMCVPVVKTKDAKDLKDHIKDHKEIIKDTKDLHKDTKEIAKDTKDTKDHTKEHKEVTKDTKDSKDSKDHIKDHKEINKDTKDLHKETKEIIKEKEIIENPKTIKDKDKEKDIFEGPGDPGMPPVTHQHENIEQRLSAIESSLSHLSAYISSSERPDLSTGALSQEADYEAVSSKLEKDANDAMQAKVSYDNNPSGQ